MRMKASLGRLARGRIGAGGRSFVGHQVLFPGLALLGLLIWAYRGCPSHHVLPSRRWVLPDSTDRAIAPHNVVILDGKQSGHDEVVAPLLWTLLRIPNVHVQVHRDTFHYAFKPLVKDWWNGHLYSFEDFWSRDLSNVHTIVMTEGAEDIHRLLQEGILERYPQLKIIALTHRASYWERHNMPATHAERNPEQPISRTVIPKVSDYVKDGRWSFLVLADFVGEGLQRNVANLPHPINRSRIAVQTFVPVMPSPWVGLRNGTLHPPQRACIIGKMMEYSRSYSRIFAQMNRSLKFRKHLTLSLVGRLGAHPLKIPKEVRTSVEIHANLSGEEFYRELASADLVLPAFSDTTAYTTCLTTGAIPSAIMARVPVLVTQRELRAYSYLKPPAFVLRQAGESEMQAIARLQREYADSSYKTGTTADWQAYEEELHRKNTRSLEKALHLDTSRIHYGREAD